MFDPEKFGQAMAEAIRDAVEPLKAQIADLTRQLAALPTPRDGADGAPGPAGPAGHDGKSVTAADVLPTLQAELQRAVAALPTPAAGAPGADGAQGPAGPAGADGKSVLVADVLPTLQAELQRAVAALPAPAPGPCGEAGQRGADGAPGRDGIGLAGAMIDRDGALQITLGDGSVRNLGAVVGKDGRDGTNGVDGVGLEDFAFEYLPETHEIAVRAACAGRTKELRYPAGGIRPGGYWRAGVTAKAGESWVNGGSMFIAMRDTSTEPDAKSADWIIGARKGRDGDDRKAAPPAPAGPIKLRA